MGAERVEVVEGRARHGRGTSGDLVVRRRPRRGWQAAVPVVGPIDPDNLEYCCQRADFAQEVLCREPPLAELLGQGVGGSGNRDATLDSWVSSREINVVLPGSSSSNSSMHSSV